MTQRRVREDIRETHHRVVSEGPSRERRVREDIRETHYRVVSEGPSRERRVREDIRENAGLERTLHITE